MSDLAAFFFGIGFGAFAMFVVGELWRPLPPLVSYEDGISLGRMQGWNMAKAGKPFPDDRENGQ